MKKFHLSKTKHSRFTEAFQVFTWSLFAVLYGTKVFIINVGSILLFLIFFNNSFFVFYQLKTFKNKQLDQQQLFRRTNKCENLFRCLSFYFC